MWKPLLSKRQACCKRGGQGGTCPPVFGRSVNPISTKGGTICPPHYYMPPYGPERYSTFYSVLHVLWLTFYERNIIKRINSGIPALVRAFELLATCLKFQIRNWFLVKTYDEQHICLKICERWYHCSALHGHKSDPFLDGLPLPKVLLDLFMFGLVVSDYYLVLTCALSFYDFGQVPIV